MDRRFVSVCILALAGISSVSAGGAGTIERRPFPSELQLCKFSLNEIPRVGDLARVWASRSAMTATFAAFADRLSCAQSKRCVAPLSMPMTFEPNVGQFDARVKYAGRGAGMTLLLTRSGMDVELAQAEGARRRASADVVRIRAGWSAARPGSDGARARDGKSAQSTEYKVRLTWRGEQPLKTISNYFIGKDPSGWRTNVPHFARAVGRADSGDLMGMSVYGTDSGVEYDLRLAPGADASKLRLRISGAQRAELSGGDVILETAQQKLRMAKPTIYTQMRGGVQKSVRGGYVIEADGSVGFRIGRHDPRAALVIDPSLTVTYATFLGGAGDETAGNIAMDANGKIYVSGTTNSSSSFPESGAATIGPALGASAFYVAKIDPMVTGANSLVYLTFLGGSRTQAGGLIAVDSTGDVALTGTTTSSDFPVTGSSQPTSGLSSGNGNDAVVGEINAQGNQLNFSAYFGGSGEESANGRGGIVVDGAGNVYIASDTQPSAADPASPDLPVTAGAFQPNWDGEQSDAFLAVFAPPAQTGGAPTLTYCTYLGTNSAGGVAVGGVAVDSGGNAYIAGSTSNASNGFPVQNAFQSAYGGGTSDGFVMKIAPAGKGPGDLVYATLLGGSGMDQILAIGLDSSLAPKAYVTGETQSPDFPVTASAYQSKLNASTVISGSANAFLAVVAQDAVSGQSSLAYSSYLGGTGTDQGVSIAVAAPASVYVAGQTNSSNFPWHDNLQPFNGASDAFLAKFDTTSSGAASLIYATPLAGTSPLDGTASTAASGVVASSTGQVYMTGQTTAADFPTAITTNAPANGFQQNCASCQEAPPSGDAFVVAIMESSTPAPSVYFNVGSENFGSSNLGTSLDGQPLAVLNGGEASLTISDIEMLGPNAGDFSTVGQSACIGTSIAPGPTPRCSMDVNFTPSVGGPEVAFLAVTDSAPGSPQLLELKGTGDAPHAQVYPASLSFGSQPTSSVSAGQTITITNTGNENLTFTAEDFSPSNGPFELQDSSCSFPATGWSLAPGASCTVQISFAPSATGPVQGQWQMTDNSDLQSNAQQMIDLSGTGAAPAPLVQINPAAMTFGSTLVGVTSASKGVTLQNQGSAALDVSAIAISGANMADYQISTAGTTCPTSGGTLAIGAQCTVAVQFAPQTAGATKTATLNFTDNAANSPQSVQLAGTATSPATLTVAPASLAFGSQSDGTTSTAQIVTITNSGSGSASLPTISITDASGATTPDFEAQYPCPEVIQAGKTCQVSVTFDPAALAVPGARTATLNVPGATPAAVALSGTATQPAITVTTSLNFASQLVGTSGTPQPVTVTNSSSGAAAGALTFTGISISGTNKLDFAITTNQCEGVNASVAPGNSCTIEIAFQPQPAATCGDSPTRSATLQLQDNAPGSPQAVALSGPAADFCLASSNGQPVTAPIQAGQTASYALEVASTGGFTGTATLSCSVPSGNEIGPCAIVTSPASNPASVQVTPTAAGQFTVNVATVAPATALPRGAPPIALITGTNAQILEATCAAALCLLLLMSAFSAKPRFAEQRARRRLVQFLQMVALVAAFAVGMAACGSGGGGGAGNDPPANRGTPPGTYTITVTATTMSGGSSTTRTASLTMTIE